MQPSDGLTNSSSIQLFDPSLVLHNSVVRLRSINEGDADKIIQLAADMSIWKYFACKMGSSSDVHCYIKEALKQNRLKARQTFVIENIEQNKIVGSTAFGNYSPNDQRIEIGWSFLGINAQGTNINRNTKFLLLTFGFDYLNLERIEFKTDVLNQRARSALIKIGATEEGILRSHTLMPGNRRRDTIYYSILRSEWPNILSNVFSEIDSLKIK